MKKLSKMDLDALKMDRRRKFVKEHPKHNSVTREELIALGLWK